MQMNASLHDRPVRKIVANSRSLTGVVPSLGPYESPLEGAFMEILRFDPAIERFTPQPLTIEYVDRHQRRRHYTPDGLIHFKPKLAGSLMPVLFEVKHRADFRKEWKHLLPKFRAAKAYGLQQGWRFCVFGEREIRTPYLDNVRFLWPYRERTPLPETRTRMLDILDDLEEADPDLLLCALCTDPANRARLIPVLWHLVATGAIGCDLSRPLTMRTRLWVTPED